MKNCRICQSPLRAEIEFLVKQKVAVTDIAKKYHQAFDVVPHTMELKITKHTKKKHPPLLNMEPVTENKRHEFSDYAQAMLEIGMTPSLMNPSQVKHSHIIAAHNAITKEQLLKVGQDAQKMAFIKFMRGAVEGEIVDVKQLGTENVPSNTD